MQDTCVVVVADFGECTNLETIFNVATEKGCDMHVVSKNVDKVCPSNGWSTVQQDNVGRDTGTALDYVIENYDSLPDTVIFTPSTLQKHDRAARFQTLMESSTSSCAKSDKHPQSKRIDEEQNFRIRWWDGPLEPSVDGAFDHWYDKYVGDFQEDGSKQICFNVMFRATKDDLRRRPLESYKQIAQQVNTSSNNEYIHFIERAVGSIFLNH